jgi:hypothetical protein
MVLDTPPNFHSRIMRTILITSLGAPFPHSRADTKAAYTKASRVFRKPKPTWKRITSLIALSTRTLRKLAQRRCQATVLSTLWRMAEKREYIKSFSRFSLSLMTYVVVMCVSNETKAKVERFSNACYKRFDTSEQAEAFNTNYDEAMKLRISSHDEPLQDMMQRLSMD